MFYPCLYYIVIFSYNHIHFLSQYLSILSLKTATNGTANIIPTIPNNLPATARLIITIIGLNLTLSPTILGTITIVSICCKTITTIAAYNALIGSPLI